MATEEKEVKIGRHRSFHSHRKPSNLDVTPPSSARRSHSFKIKWLKNVIPIKFRPFAHLDDDSPIQTTDDPISPAGAADVVFRKITLQLDTPTVITDLEDSLGIKVQFYGELSETIQEGKLDILQVAGIDSNSPAYRCGQLSIGDKLISINGHEVTTSNLDELLKSLGEVSEIELVVTRVAFLKDDFKIQPDKITRIDPDLIVSKGDTRQNDEEVDLYQVPHVALCLTMGSSADEDGDKDIVYKFSLSDTQAKVLTALRGLFLTMSDVLLQVTLDNVFATSLLIDKMITNVVYYQFEQNLFILAVPDQRCGLFLLNRTIRNIARLLKVLYGSLHSAFFSTQNEQNLNKIFKYALYRLLTPATDLASMRFLKAFYPTYLAHLFEAAPSLFLPNVDQALVSGALTKLECGSYFQMPGQMTHTRRAYASLGSCLFYKGYLVASRMRDEDFLDTRLLCFYYGLLDASKRHIGGNITLWHKMNLQRLQGEKRSYGVFTEDSYVYLLVVCVNSCVIATLLECIIPSDTISQSEADPIYVNSARDTIKYLECDGFFAICDDRINNVSCAELASADTFTTSDSAVKRSSSLSASSRRSTVSTGNTPNHHRHPSGGSINFLLRSPNLSLNVSRHKNPPNSPVVDRKVLSANDDGSVSAATLRNGNPEKLSSSHGNDLLEADSSQARERASSYGLHRASPIVSRKNAISANTAYSYLDTTVEQSRSEGFSIRNVTSGKINVLFHYIGINSKTGMLISPTSRELASIDGALQRKIVTKFYWACAVIRNTFLSRQGQGKKPENVSPKFVKKSLNVYEQGILFTLSPERVGGGGGKKLRKPLRYWVIGYHESISQNICEVAHRIGFAWNK
ncbi:uncharacterized protein TRIADDRAFT_57004 [Trichoplax adhaerens]|uniref:Protein inturned n=1 Tax=Trichoplax adhaerens TaxID=10228 RepID=B3RX57_TRIAD|nr:hypothetical protein TRIADDRAFT_57004 [Trichoplax adhaerens]EDV24813.1 hypothetical protein TRIADDRAFT_57004 [Trichoplax adhaerens]|eukprot:XP_002112703.1 hypothetical protein TRIADDRAFT_57004 [Trichoplax adhaerens]